MIYGIGTDICALDRVQSILNASYAERFVLKVLTVEETKRFYSLSETKKIEFLAGRFALKEAVSKALGTGIGQYVAFKDINISNQPSGKPICELSDEVYNKLNLNKHNITIHVSLSHEKKYAIAFVTIEQL